MKRVVVGLAMALAGSVAVTAWAQPEHGGPRGPHAEFGAPGMFFGSGERADRVVDRMLDGLNATDAQRAQIKQIARAASADLKALHDASRGQRDQAMAVFTAPVVDARAVETLRLQRMAQHDQVSKRISQAMLDVSNVLTPEQRVKLGERIKQREQRMKERMQHRKEHRGHGASAPTR